MKFDREKWTQRLRDPIWQFFGVVMAIIALIISTLVAYDVYLKTQMRPELTVTLHQKFRLVYFAREYESDIQVYYKGTEAHNVSSFYFALENSGNSPIRPEDYVKPLLFYVESPSEVASVEITYRSPVSVDLTVTQVLTNAFELSKSLLNPKDVVLFQVILVNDSDTGSEPRLKYEGRIAGIQEIKSITYSDPDLLFSTMYYSLTFTDLFNLAMTTVAFLGLTFLALQARAPEFWTGRFVTTEIMLITFMTGATIFYFYSLIDDLIEGPTTNWWNTWSTAIILGGLLIIGYIFYLAIKLRFINLSRNRQRVEN